MININKTELSHLGVKGLSKIYRNETKFEESHLKLKIHKPFLKPVKTISTPGTAVTGENINSVKMIIPVDNFPFNGMKNEEGAGKTKQNSDPSKPTWYFTSTTGLIMVLQALYALLFTALVRYSDEANGGQIENSIHSFLGGFEHNGLDSDFQGFICVSIFIFISCAVHLVHCNFDLYTDVLLVSCSSIQWAIIIRGLFYDSNGKTVVISIKRIIVSQYTCLSVVLSKSGLLGRASLLQLLVLSLLHVPLQLLASHLLDNYLYVNDIGKSMQCHIFGSFFGIAASLALFRTRVTKRDHHGFSFLGTFLLAISWSSLSMSSISKDGQRRMLINTFLAMTSALVIGFPLSSACNSSRKFCFELIQDGVIGSGVVISSVSALMIESYGALSIGILTSTFSILFSGLVMPKLNKIVGEHDTCRVFVPHGVAGVVGGLVSAILAAIAQPDFVNYGYRLYEIYPARSPEEGSEALMEVQKYLPIPGGRGRSAAMQAAMQVLGTLVVVSLSAVGGAVTGLILRLRIFSHCRIPESSNSNVFDGRQITHDSEFTSVCETENIQTNC